jgi:NADH dehydrogenase
VVRGLADRGAGVRVLTRDPRRAEHLRGVAQDTVVGDVRDRRSLAPAVEGVGTVVSAVHGFAGPGRVSPASVDRAGNANLTTAARGMGADAVMVSVVGASPASPMELFRCKYAAEQQLKSSGVGWTIVRATAFVELWAEILQRRVVFGRGENPINFVSVHDVARVVIAAVLDPGLRGQCLEVGGPENVSVNQLAAMLNEARDEHRGVRHVPRSLLRAVAPFHRVPRAALAMDTVDMTFAAPASLLGVPPTSLKEALTQAVAA